MLPVWRRAHVRRGIPNHNLLSLACNCSIILLFVEQFNTYVFFFSFQCFVSSLCNDISSHTPINTTEVKYLRHVNKPNVGQVPSPCREIGRAVQRELVGVDIRESGVECRECVLKMVRD